MIIIYVLFYEQYMYFEIIGKINNIKVIAVGNSIRELPQLRQKYGEGRWRKLKGIAQVSLENGNIRQAEIHWYEAHGIYWSIVLQFFWVLGEIELAFSPLSLELWCSSEVEEH